MPEIVVPQDICDYIVDFVADDIPEAHPWYQPLPRSQRDAFATCSLLGRNWLPRSSYYLLGRAIVSDELRFLQRAQSSSRLTENVQNIAFAYSSLRRDVDPDVIETIISLLPRLQRLAFDMGDSTVPELPQPPRLRRSLNNLRIDTMSATSALYYLSRFESIDELYLCKVIHDGSSPLVVQDTNSLAVRDLTLVKSTGSSSAGQLIEAIHDLLAPKALQRLTIDEGKSRCDASLKKWFDPSPGSFGNSLRFFSVRLSNITSSGFNGTSGTFHQILRGCSVLTTRGY